MINANKHHQTEKNFQDDFPEKKMLAGGPGEASLWPALLTPRTD